MSTIHIDYFGMPGSGQTVKEAKIDAGRKIEAALDGSYSPVLLNHRGTLLVLSRAPRYGWGYRMFDLTQLKLRTDAGHCSSGFEDFDSALLAAVKHLADNTRLHGERDSALFDALRGRDADQARRDFALSASRNDDFQDRYKLAVANGLSSGDSHDFALRNPARRELWDRLEVPSAN